VPHGPRRDRPAAGARAELGDPRVARAIGPVQVEAAVGRKAGVEGDAQEPLLRPRQDAAAQVEGHLCAITVEPQDAPGLLEGPEGARVAGRRADPRRAVEAVGDSLDVEVVGGARLHGRARRLAGPRGVLAAAARCGGQHGGGERDGDYRGGAAAHGGAY
jgi:hypothetical protein